MSLVSLSFRKPDIAKKKSAVRDVSGSISDPVGILAVSGVSYKPSQAGICFTRWDLSDRMETHWLIILLSLSHSGTVSTEDYFQQPDQISSKQGLISQPVFVSPDSFASSPRLIEWFVLLGGLVLYANMMAGNKQNLANLTQQMESLSAELNQTREGIFGKLEVEMFG